MSQHDVRTLQRRVGIMHRERVRARDLTYDGSMEHTINTDYVGKLRSMQMQLAKILIKIPNGA